MNKKDIIKICQENKEIFKETTKDIEYEDKGVFNSEMLLFVSLVRHFNIKEIWESGRARAQSTHVISECFKDDDVDIYSIELIKDTNDDKVAKDRLSKFEKIRLLYGDSQKILLNNLFTREVVVIIDGPKGEEAINLAYSLLKDKNVKMVFLHDYCKDSHLRKTVENKFKNIFFTDDEEYVESFKDLDDKCWEGHAKIGRFPYRRHNKIMQSYSSTLCVIFNEL
jgi:hypothetical protein